MAGEAVAIMTAIYNHWTRLVDWTGGLHKADKVSLVQEESCFGANIMHHATLQASESHYKA